MVMVIWRLFPKKGTANGHRLGSVAATVSVDSQIDSDVHMTTWNRWDAHIY